MSLQITQEMGTMNLLSHYNQHIDVDCALEHRRLLTHQIIPSNRLWMMRWD